jgi:hypothetical protein
MWNQLPSERLRFWQDFRKTISKKPLEEAVKDAQHLWCYAPYVAHYLTTDHIEEWPGPWELVYENYYCDLAKALGIVYTLHLSEHKPDLEIRLYNEPSTKEQYNLVFVDKGKYVLNYVHDEVVNKTHVDSGLKLVRTISPKDLGLEKLQ